MDRYITMEEIIEICKQHKKVRLQVHHTWEPSHEDYNGSNGLKLVQSMRNHHINKNGWDDIGQHLTLLPDGKFVTGRDFSKTPCGIGSYNKNTDLMIEMIGNFDVGYDKLEGSQKKSILKLAKYFLDYFGEKGIIFHNEVASKTCPGSSIAKKEFIKEVAKYMEEKIYNKIEEVPEWAKEDVKFMIDKEILKGDGKGNLGLSETLMRSLVFSKRMCEYYAKK